MGSSKKFKKFSPVRGRDTGQQREGGFHPGEDLQGVDLVAEHGDSKKMWPETLSREPFETPVNQWVGSC